MISVHSSKVVLALQKQIFRMWKYVRGKIHQKSIIIVNDYIAVQNKIRLASTTHGSEIADDGSGWAQYVLADQRTG